MKPKPGDTVYSKSSFIGIPGRIYRIIDDYSAIVEFPWMGSRIYPPVPIADLQSDPIIIPAPGNILVSDRDSAIVIEVRKSKRHRDVKAVWLTRKDIQVFKLAELAFFHLDTVNIFSAPIVLILEGKEMSARGIYPRSGFVVVDGLELPVHRSGVRVAQSNKLKLVREFNAKS